MAADSIICLVYINPEGIAKSVLDTIKTQITNGLDSDDGINAWSVHFEEVTLPYRDLLAKARCVTQLDAGCFYILNKDSADKGAVLCVETQVYTDVKGLTYRFPSAASSRKFYLAPEFASAMAVNLSIANMDWEDFSNEFGHAQLKLGEVCKPW